MNRLLLIDGSYYVYRSFFAHPALCNQRGEPTGAIYGFVKSIARMLRHVQPTHAAVIWDGIPNRRLAIQPDYKQHREGRCEDMKAQWSVIERLVPMMGMQGLRDPDAESDDLMASYASWAAVEEPGCPHEWQTILATADKDLFACVNESTFIYSVPRNRGPGDPEFTFVDEAAVLAKWGVKPSQFSDLLALMGDDVDGIVGLKGVGPKTAAKWIQKYDSAILAVQCERPESEVMIMTNRAMTKLDTDLALPASLESLALQPFTPEFRGAMEACDINADAL